MNKYISPRALEREKIITKENNKFDIDIIKVLKYIIGTIDFEVTIIARSQLWELTGRDLAIIEPDRSFVVALATIDVLLGNDEEIIVRDSSDAGLLSLRLDDVLADVSKPFSTLEDLLCLILPLVTDLAGLLSSSFFGSARDEICEWWMTMKCYECGKDIFLRNSYDVYACGFMHWDVRCRFVFLQVTHNVSCRW